jgi:hypothetical protein
VADTDPRELIGAVCGSLSESVETTGPPFEPPFWALNPPPFADEPLDPANPLELLLTALLDADGLGVGRLELFGVEWLGAELVGGLTGVVGAVV